MREEELWAAAFVLGLVGYCVLLWLLGRLAS